MKINKENFSAGSRACTAYASEKPKCILIQPVDDHDLEVLDSEVDEICKGQKDPFVLIAFKIDDWNKELSPWEAPAVFGNENFGSGAKETLEFVVQELLPYVRERYSLEASIPVIIGGYSLAGFFALWSSYQKPDFAAVMAASPSVWFNGWMDYAKSYEPKTDAVYLSLGDKEEKTRNKVMAQVGDAIREQEAILSEQVVNCILEWNQGNHFRDADLRCAKGFIWCMKAISTNSTGE